jgi:cytochrome b561
MTQTYSPTQKILHWASAALIVTLLPIGVIMSGRDPDPVTNALYELHKSFGLTVFSLALLRVGLRFWWGAPPLVPGLPAWQRFAAHTSHYALYLLIVLVPLSGWAATSACCAPVNLFWTLPLSLPVSGGMETAKAIFQAHKLLAFLLAAIVIVHVAAALHHHIVRRDETLKRMLRAKA